MVSRTERVKKNLIVNMLKYATQLVMQFVLRTFLIYYMGAEYIGLNGLYTNIFAFLNLAELGIGNAIVFSCYKPIAEGNTEKVKALQQLYKKFYAIIFCVVLLIGGLLIPFVDLFIKNDITVNINIYLLFVMYLFNTLIGYLSAHKRSMLFAHQRADLENGIRTICILGMSIVQAIVLVVFKNYYLFFAANIVATGVECLLTHIVANKYFPELKGKSSEKIDIETRKEITKNITALSMHKIGGVVVGTTDNIIISSFLGVVILGAYSNYLLITTAIASIMNLFVTALQGSVGNYIASKTKEEVYEKFKQVDFAFAIISGFVTICFLVLIQPFIEAWTGGGEYLLGFETIALLAISMYFNRRRASVLLFRDCAGLFWKDRWKPIFESIINLAVSLVLVHWLGINGIFIGTIASTLFAPFWVEPYVLYKHYFQKSLKSYFGRYVIDVVITIITAIIVFIVCSFIPHVTTLWLILKFAICIILSALLLVLCYCNFKEFKSLFNIFKDMTRKLFRRKHKDID